MNSPTEKKCTKCGEVKDLSMFYKHKLSKYGVTSSCKKCCNEKSIQYIKNNPEKRKVIVANYHKNNTKKRKEYAKIYKQNNPKYHISWYEKNKDKASLSGKKYREKNRDIILLKHKVYRLNHLQNS